MGHWFPGTGVPRGDFAKRKAGKDRNMKQQGNGVLKSENGEIISEVTYSITPSPLEGKKRQDSIRLTASKGLSSSQILASAILETEDGRRFRLVITSTLVPSTRLLEAVATEIRE